MWCRNTRSVAWLFAAALAMPLVGISPCVYGQILIDDFDHMDPTLPGWTLADLSAGQAWGPGEYDPSSGALRIYHSGSELVPPGTPFTTTAMFALRNETTDPLFSNGFVRAKIRTDEVQNSTSTFIRTDLATATGYGLFGFTKPPGQMPELDGTFLMSKFVNGVETNIWASGIEYLPGEDWNVELGAVGDQISGKVWRVGDLEPMTPQFLMIDDNPIMSGMIAIASDKSLGNTIPARGDATYDDIYFTPVAFAPITVDIKPGSDVAPINLKSKGKLPVAILSTEDFDAKLVDPATLLFGDPSLMNAGAAPVSPLRSGQEDVNNDGLVDLTLKFSMRDLLDNEVIGAETLQGYLAGQLYDGTVIAGRDAVNIVGLAGQAIPEPSSLLLILAGALALTICRRK
jgi:hypothetical protein